jgi:alpha-ketoglutarate-dependent dioxygenase FTO
MALQTCYQGFAVDHQVLPLLPTLSSSCTTTTTTTTSPTTLTESTVQQALSNMEQLGYFRADITQPFGLGTPCAKTYVTRCLVGEPGTTYKYLGLRMFASSWNNNNNNKKERTTTTSTQEKNESQDPLQIMYQLKQVLRQRSRHYLDELQRQRQDALLRGRNDFDICLVNRMEYSSRLKLEPTMQQHRCAVSWHADSSLEHYSTIAVYQTLQQPKATATLASGDIGHVGASTMMLSTGKQNKFKHHKSNNLDAATTTTTTSKNHPAATDSTPHANISLREGGGWTVALRVAPNAEGPDAATHHRRRDEDGEQEQEQDETTASTTAPPIAVSLPSGSAYYLLEDFNHHHQHAVLTEDHQDDDHHSNTIRFSCTYRLLRASHHVDYVLERGLRTCRNFHKKGSKMWRSEQLLLTDMESDWIRQFYIQGQQHYNLLWKVRNTHTHTQRCMQ